MAIPSRSVKSPVALALDIGGTWTRAGLLTTDGDILDTDRFRTDSLMSSQAYVDAVVDLLGGVRDPSDQAPVGLGVSVTGPVDPSTGRLYTPPNTGVALAGLALGQRLQEATGLRVVVDRDTNVAALAEHRLGAACGVDDFVYLTVSTGVGGAVMLGGRLMRGLQGVAGELGHVSIDPSGPPCGCGRRGCLEALAAGPALAGAARVAAAGDSGSTVLRRIIEDGGPLTGEQVHAAASLGDPIAQGVLARAGAAVASACVDLVNVFNPALVVLGGSVARGNPEWVQRAGERVGREALEPARDTAHIVPGELGDDAGLIGAALLVAEQA